MSDTSFHKGVWTDWEKGRALGQTLTLSSENGSLFIAFLALFVRLTGSHVWNIVRFIAHQLRSRSNAQPALYHQQQVVLRNNPGSTDAFWQFTLLSWAWHSRVASGVWLSIPWASLALLQILALTAAGLFSSKVATVGGGDILINAGDNCGVVQFPTKNGNFTSAEARQWGATLVERKQGLRDSLTYSAQCYGTSVTIGCNTYISRALATTTDSNAACPFVSEICKSGAILIDTGDIETRRDLGINTPKTERLILRSQLSCAPLNTDDYQSPWAAPDVQTPIVDDEFKYYYYGSGLDPDHQVTNNYTFALTKSSLLTAKEPYTFEIAQAYAGGSYLDTFIPISALERHDADVFLFEMTNAAQYESPVFDPLFNATKEFTNAFFASNSLYVAADPFSFMGCAQQWQLCNPNLPPSTGCTAFNGLEALKALLFGDSNILNLNGQQNALLYHLLNGTLSQNAFSGSLNDLGSQVILAAAMVEGGNALQSMGLPNDQWVLEMQHLFNVQLANIQRRTVEYAAGPTDVNVYPYIQQPATELENQLCSAQLVRGRSATSFSVFGLCVILIGGAFLVLLDFVLPWITFRAYRILRKSSSRRIEWQVGSTLQLQRMAFEGSGQGIWVGREDDVPVTLNGEMLSLDPLMGMRQ